MRRTPFPTPRAAFGAVVLPLLALLLPMVAPAPLQGQVDAALLGGVDGTRPEAHLLAGVRGGYLVLRGVGVETLFLEGRGAGYDSRLLAGGLAWRFLSTPLGDLRLWAGPGWYRERLSDHGGVDPRSVTAVALGVVGRVPVGPVRVSLGVTGWQGALEAEGFARSETVNGLRLTVGVGR